MKLWLGEEVALVTKDAEIAPHFLLSDANPEYAGAALESDRLDLAGFIERYYGNRLRVKFSIAA